MNRKLLVTVTTILISFSAFAQGDKEKSPSWYEIAGGIIAIPATLLAIYSSWNLIKSNKTGDSKAKLEFEKLNLEIENLKLDLEEKKKKLYPSPVTISPAPPMVKQPIYIRSVNTQVNPVLSVQTFSNLIGYLALILPMVLVTGELILAGNFEIQLSLGHYYYTSMNYVYVVLHCLLAMLLFFYKGYQKVDDAVTNVEALFCILIAACPVQSDIIVLRYIHFASVSAFLVLHSYFSIFLFTKSVIPRENLTHKKILKNRIYRMCGIIIINCVLSIAIVQLFFEPMIKNYKPTFWLETIAYWAFGISWMIKGSFILKDRHEY